MPRLTEQEQQEIVRFIEADRPLPEKYRFLLFEDKREVELVWNGKTSEVCNIVLPFQVIEQVDEPRAEKPAETALQMDMFSLDGRWRGGNRMWPHRTNFSSSVRAAMSLTSVMTRRVWQEPHPSAEKRLFCVALGG